MPATRLNAFYGVSFLAAGVCVALWGLVHPWGTVAGAEVARSHEWAASHTFHFAGGLLGCIGLLGLAHRQGASSALERAGYFVAFAGTVLYTGTGIFTAFVWPLLAERAPAMVELSGPFFSSPHPILAVTKITFSLGFILLAVTLARAGVLARWAAAAAVMGALLLVPPPYPLTPFPWVIFPLGSVLLGIGMAAIGRAVWTGRARPPA